MSRQSAVHFEPVSMLTILKGLKKRCAIIVKVNFSSTEFSASSFYGAVCDTATTSTPMHKDPVASASSEKITANEITESRKRKLIETSDASSPELPTKQQRLSNGFKIIEELKCISTGSGSEIAQKNVSVVTIIDDDDTIECDTTLKAPDMSSDSKDTVNHGAIGSGAANDDSLSEKETTRSEESRESSRYETISETYCSDDLSNVSSISNIPLDSSDESVRLHQLTEEGDSVVFVSETFPSNLGTGYGKIVCKQQPDQPMPVFNNFYRSSKEEKGAKRMIIIDGSNVAFAHSSHRKEFSVEGINICIDYFIERGFDVKAVVPQMRLKRANSTNGELLEQLKDDGKVIVTPCKSLPNGKFVASYDDRFILDLAHEFDGVVISNDNFRDLFNENDDYKKIIESRIIGFMFCNDLILFPTDPYGRNGLKSDEILYKK